METGGIYACVHLQATARAAGVQSTCEGAGTVSEAALEAVRPRKGLVDSNPTPPTVGGHPPG